MKNDYRMFAITSSTPIFTVVCIVERLVLKTIYVQIEEILQFLGQKSVVYNQGWFIIKRGLYWQTYSKHVDNYNTSL